MAVGSLEDKVNQAGRALPLLRGAPAGALPFPIPPQFMASTQGGVTCAS